MVYATNVELYRCAHIRTAPSVQVFKLVSNRRKRDVKWTVIGEWTARDGRFAPHEHSGRPSWECRTTTQDEHLQKFHNEIGFIPGYRGFIPGRRNTLGTSPVGAVPRRTYLRRQIHHLGHRDQPPKTIAAPFDCLITWRRRSTR